MNRKERRQQGARNRHAPGSAAVAAPGGQAAALFAQAAAALQSGRPQEAETLLRQVLQLDPGHAEAHNLLGLICGRKGANREALEHFRKAAALRPESAEFVNNLGIAELNAGDLENAQRSFEKAIATDPSLAQAHQNLGIVFQKRRDLERAIACFRQAIALVPNFANAHLNLGNALSDAGHHDEAVTVLRKLVALAPGAPMALFNLATAYKNAGRIDDAAAAAQQILARDPNSVAAHVLIAKFLWSAGRLEGAEAAARRALALEPKNADAHNILGTVLMTAGRFPEAVACLDAALAVQPDNPEVIYKLTSVSKAHSTPEFASRIETMLKTSRPAEQKIDLHFALGKILDDRGEYERAFGNYRTANDAARAAAPFDGREWLNFVDRSIAAFTPELFAQRKFPGHDSRRPIFIVGMPRSGTTLIEQIIAAHPHVAGGGEMETIERLARDLPRRLGVASPYPECVAGVGADAANDVAAAYLEALDKVDAAATRVTDKNPLNFQYLGLIALLFPNAAVIHCRRDPMDTCLSCYFAKFDRHLSFTYDLETLGAYFRGYARLMAHWHKVLPIKMLDVAYEDVVADQEGMSRRIIAHCGLEWDDRCLAFHKSERPVTTASMWQVRQPIYKTAVARWKSYEPYLAPLRAVLDEPRGTS